jgi:hypothetical protein
MSGHDPHAHSSRWVSSVSQPGLSTSRRWYAFLAVLFFVCSVVSVGLVMDKYPFPSPIDEVVHYDFIHDAPHVPVIGEKISQSAMHEWACRTSGPEYVLPLPPCARGPYDPAAFPGAGYSTAGGSGPVYYYVTAAFARPLAAVSGWSLFSVSRGFGAIWLAGLMMVIYLVAERLGASRLAGAGVAVLVGTGSATITSAATMGPDTATALTSGLVLLATLSYDGTRRRAVWFLLAVAIAALTKLTAFEAVGAALIYLILLPLLARRSAGDAQGHREPEAPPMRACLLTAAAGLATFLVVSFLWGLRLSLTATEGPEVNPLYDLLHADSVDWGGISETLVYVFFSPGTGNWQPAFFTDGTNNFVGAVTAGLLSVGVLAAALALRSAPRVSALGIGLLVLTLVGPFLLVGLNFYGNHLFYMLSPRHGYGLLPGLAACAAVLARGPGPSRALALLAVLSMVNVLT